MAILLSFGEVISPHMIVREDMETMIISGRSKVGTSVTDQTKVPSKSMMRVQSLALSRRQDPFRVRAWEEEDDDLLKEDEMWGMTGGGVVFLLALLICPRKSGRIVLKMLS